MPRAIYREAAVGTFELKRCCVDISSISRIFALRLSICYSLKPLLQTDHFFQTDHDHCRIFCQVWPQLADCLGQWAAGLRLRARSRYTSFQSGPSLSARWSMRPRAWRADVSAISWVSRASLIPPVSLSVTSMTIPTLGSFCSAEVSRILRLPRSSPKLKKLGCFYPIEASQVGCLLDRGMVSSPPT
jgi:hypothetical protein